jgi:hypothetical protein
MTNNLRGRVLLSQNSPKIMAATRGLVYRCGRRPAYTFNGFRVTRAQVRRILRERGLSNRPGTGNNQYTSEVDMAHIYINENPK